MTETDDFRAAEHLAKLDAAAQQRRVVERKKSTTRPWSGD